MQSFACPENGWIDGVPLAAGVGPGRFAWMATDLADLRRPADLRGTDTLLPEVPGVIVNPRRPTVSTRLVTMIFAGDCDSDGAPGLPADQQVWVNLALFQSLVIEPPGGDPRRTVAVTHGALQWTGHLVVESFDIRERGPAEIVGVLEVSLPMGQLEMEVVP